MHPSDAIINPNPPESVLEVRQYHGAGYAPVIDFGVWRVATLNFSEDMLPEAIDQMERHLETDEVFVLLTGQCVLYLGEGDQTITRVQAVEMTPALYYNVKKDGWHACSLSPDAVVLLVENQDTSAKNSDYRQLTPVQRAEVARLGKALLKA
jgi:hypothetical protein